MRPFEEVRKAILAELSPAREREVLRENASRTLFSVNDEEYTVADFQHFYEQLSEETQAEFQAPEDKERLIDRMIEHTLLAQDARAKRLDPNYRGRIEDLTQAVLQGTLYQQEIVNQIRLEDIDDSEVEAYYEEHRDDFLRPAQAKISYIRIGIGDDEKLARAKADEAYAMATNGYDFGEVVRRYSDDDWTASKDGRIEEFLVLEEQGLPLQSPQELQQHHPFHEVVFALEPGVISHPFKFRGSYLIVKVNDKKEGGTIPLEELRSSIRRLLLDQKRRQKTEELRRELMDAAHLTINKEAIEYLKKVLKQAKTVKQV